MTTRSFGSVSESVSLERACVDLRAPKKPLGPEIKTREPLGTVGIVGQRVRMGGRREGEGKQQPRVVGGPSASGVLGSKVCLFGGGVCKAFCWT
jgi:hypothetical protein